MKIAKLALKAVLLLGLLTGFGAAELYPKMGTITVKLNGVESNKGTLLLYLYDKKDRWMKPERAAVVEKVQPKAGEMVIQLSAPLGRRYALSVIHDENDNGKVDTGFPIPKPVEPVGASYFTGNSIPRFYNCSFRFNQEPLELEVQMRRP